MNSRKKDHNCGTKTAMNMDFNEYTGKATFTYRRNPMHERSFQILKHDENSNQLLPFGEYTVLDNSEDPAFTEKKVINLVSMLNGRKKLVDLSGETDSRLLFHVPEKNEDDPMSKVIFYTYKAEGVSRENAVFTFEGEISGRQHN